MVMMGNKENIFKREAWKKIERWLIIHLGTRVLSLWFSTCRIRIVGEAYHREYILSNRKMVGATWHRNAVFLVWFFRKVHPMIMFSRSRDGDLIASFAEKLGVIPVRGSSGKGGREALEIMNDYLTRPGNHKAATVMDGPVGPACIAKKGLIALAKETGQPLLPIMMSASPAITFHKAWDKTILPLPFSRVVVSYREPWMVEKNTDESELERLREDVEKTLNDMLKEADSMAGYQP